MCSSGYCWDLCGYQEYFYLKKSKLKKKIAKNCLKNMKGVISLATETIKTKGKNLSTAFVGYYKFSENKLRGCLFAFAFIFEFNL